MEVVSSSPEGSEEDDDAVLMQIRSIGLSALDRASEIRVSSGAAAARDAGARTGCTDEGREGPPPGSARSGDGDEAHEPNSSTSPARPARAAGDDAGTQAASPADVLGSGRAAAPPGAGGWAPCAGTLGAGGVVQYAAAGAAPGGCGFRVPRAGPRGPSAARHQGGVAPPPDAPTPACHPILQGRLEEARSLHAALAASDQSGTGTRRAGGGSIADRSPALARILGNRAADTARDDTRQGIRMGDLLSTPARALERRAAEAARGTGGPGELARATGTGLRPIDLGARP